MAHGEHLLTSTTPRVSVVVTTYQRAHHLGGVIAMLLNQTLADIEVIVADDGSTDGTPDVVRRIDDPRLRYLRREHMGMPAILNEGFAAARGAYIMTCHDHDIYEPTLLAELADALDRFPSAAYAHCGLLVVDPENTRIVGRHVCDFLPLTEGRAFLEAQLLPGMDSPVCALTMVRATALGGEAFDAFYGFVADVEMWLRLATRGDVAYVARPLIRTRQRDEASELSHISHRLALHSLRAKRAYLHLVTGRARRRIERGWRRQATTTVLRELLYVRPERRDEALGDLRSLAIEAGSAFARVAVAIFGSVPPRMVTGTLRPLRTTARWWRGAAAAR